MTEVRVTDPFTRSELYERRVDWINALKSGQFLQAKGRLVKTNYATGEIKYCCLGVACEVLGPKFGISRAESDYFYERNGSAASLMLPEDLRKYLSLSREDQNILSVANDSGASFEIIASIIGAMDFYEDKK